MKAIYILATAAAIAVVLVIIASCLHPAPLAWPGRGALIASSWLTSAALISAVIAMCREF